jgi:hypothetical protein
MQQLHPTANIGRSAEAQIATNGGQHPSRSENPPSRPEVAGYPLPTARFSRIQRSRALQNLDVRIHATSARSASASASRASVSFP